MAAPRLVLDTDLAMAAGIRGADVDDGFALAVALSSPELVVQLVTTVHGNTDLASATERTRELLRLLRRPDLDVLPGAAGPLDRDAPPAPTPAARAIADRVLAAPGEVTVVAIGPLTNVATALALDPRVAGAVAEVVLMGGAYLPDTLPAGVAEWNVRCDPQAAQLVFDSGAPVRAVGLDVTLQVRMDRAGAERLRDTGDPFGALAADAALAWIDVLDERGGDPTASTGSFALHDPLAVLALLRPDLLTWSPADVRVEPSGATTTTLTQGSGPVRVATAVDARAAESALMDALTGTTSRRP